MGISTPKVPGGTPFYGQGYASVKTLKDYLVYPTGERTTDGTEVLRVTAGTSKVTCPVCHRELPAGGRAADGAVTVWRPRKTQLVLDVANRPAFEWLVKNHLQTLLGAIENSQGDDGVLSRNRGGIEAPDPRKAKNSFEFVELMNALVEWANPPSLRQLVSRVPELRRSTLSEALNRPDRLPKQELLQALVKACRAEADWPKWLQTWERLKAEQKARRSLVRYAAPIPPNMMRKMNLDDIK